MVRLIIFFILLLISNEALSCPWWPGVSVRFESDNNEVLYNPVLINEETLSKILPIEDFLYRDSILSAYRLEEEGMFQEALEIYKEVFKNAHESLHYQRATPYILFSLNVAADRIDLFEHTDTLEKETLKRYLQAKHYMEKKEYAQAQIIFDELMNRQEIKDSLFDNLIYAQASINFLMGSSSSAASNYKKVITAYPTSEKILPSMYMYGRCNLLMYITTKENRFFDEALNYFQLLLKQAPPKYYLKDDTLGEIARLYCISGQYLKGIEYYLRILKEYSQGDMLEQARESILGLEEEFNFIFNIDSESWNSGGVLNSYVLQNTPQEVRDYISAHKSEWFPDYFAYQKAKEYFYNSNYYDYRYDHSKRESLELAIESFKKLIKDYPKSSYISQSLFFLGVSYLRIGGYGKNWWDYYGAAPDKKIDVLKESQGCFEKLVQYHPYSPFADDALIELYYIYKEVNAPQNFFNAFKTVATNYPRGDKFHKAFNLLRSLIEENGMKEELSKAGLEEEYLFATKQYISLLEKYPKSKYAFQSLALAFNEIEKEDVGMLNLKAWKGHYGHLDYSIEDYGSLDYSIEDYGSPDYSIENYSRDSESLKKTIEQSNAKKTEALNRILAVTMEFLKNYPKNEEKDLIRLHLAKTYIYLQRGDEALNILELLLKSKITKWWLDEIYWLRVQAFYQMKQFDKAVESLKILIDKFPESRFTFNAKEKIALIYEDASRLEDALYTYFKLSQKEGSADDEGTAYSLDVDYLLNILMDTESMERFIKKYPQHPQKNSVIYSLGLRYFRNDQFDKARQTLIKIKITGDFEVIKKHLKDIDTLSALYSKYQNASTKEEKDTFLYKIASYYYKDDYLFYNEVMGGLIEPLYHQFGFRSKEEIALINDYLEKNNSKIRAMKIYQQIVDEFPHSKLIPESLYKIALCNLKLADYNKLFREREKEFLQGACQAFLKLVDTYPKNSLADDSLYWAAYYKEDEKKAKELYKRLIKEFPNGDMVKKLIKGQMHFSNYNNWNFDNQELYSLLEQLKK